jgi:hypothetical protein
VSEGAHARCSPNVEGRTRWPLAKESATILRDNIANRQLSIPPLQKILLKYPTCSCFCRFSPPSLGFRYGLMSNEPARLSLQNPARKGYSTRISYVKHAHVGGVYNHTASAKQGAWPCELDGDQGNEPGRLSLVSSNLRSEVRDTRSTLHRSLTGG